MKKPNILAIDDEDSVRISLTETFSDIYNIIPASSDREAYEILGREDIDVVLLDLRLPLLDIGVKTFKEIHRKRPDLNIIIVTAVEAEGKEKLREYASEIFAYVVKPWNIEEIHKVINQALADREKGLSDEDAHYQLQGIYKKEIRKKKGTLSKQKTILAIDDELSTIQSLEMILENMGGYNLIKAFDGNEGLNKYKEYKNKIDYVFVDYSMNGMNGLEFIEKFRELNNKIPVYLMTGLIPPDDFPKLVADKGGNNIIPKPFSIEIIKETLEI
ncbi:MAG: CheY-like receiver AAA-type ATPase and DNA-binding domain-containing response regulator [Candidatus Saganbacteria bacterium]|uniref:CheY-like receiver AAA-type ATPase and DNA-binding domain-containing response regulator n=1 Tax=Candidatus Saganbacteria bacterium TaxID=2575572 RepID=A0A833KZY0_UNCSA|nr:MAG: CheY-like receiver AAA-type ATPase and DNA-binding domain-containing response regulator [Candidatus Saganbacteria bacterium]